jgi:hypothetical protein
MRESSSYALRASEKQLKKTPLEGAKDRSAVFPSES